MTPDDVRRQVRERYKRLHITARPAQLWCLLTPEELHFLVQCAIVPSNEWVGTPIYSRQEIDGWIDTHTREGKHLADQIATLTGRAKLIEDAVAEIQEDLISDG